MDKTPQKFNPQALKIAQELKKFDAPAGIVAKCALDMIEIRNEIREELKKQADVMRKIARDGEKKLSKAKKQAQDEVKKVEKQHDAIMERLREAQPELRDIEFRMNLEDGTWTHEGPRSLDQENNATPEVSATPEVMASIHDMVGDLMKRISARS